MTSVPWFFSIRLLWCIATATGSGTSLADTSCVVVTYNVENYHIRDWGNRHEKPAASRAAVSKILAEIHPDVVALQEIGESAALDELQHSLASRGVPLPYREHLGGWDTNLFIAVLSRFPILRRAPHTNDSFLLDGRRFHSSRPVLEVDLELTPGRRLSLITAHLKSRRPIAAADEAALRAEEARLLRSHVDTALQRNGDQPLIVCGDFNDSPDSKVLKTLLGRGRLHLLDTRPTERGVDSGTMDSPIRSVTWTHFFAREDSYSRIDYVLLSPASEAFCVRGGTYVWSGSGWGSASDHRPVICELRFPDR